MCEDFLELDKNLKQAIAAWISELDKEVIRCDGEWSIAFTAAKDGLNDAYDARSHHLQMCTLCRERPVCQINREQEIAKSPLRSA